MRLSIFVLVLFCIEMSSCKPVAYFNSPNDLFKKTGIVYLLDGSKKEGEITIMFETGQSANNFIRIKKGGSEEKISVDSIRFYSIDNENYFPKIIDLDFSGSQRLLFVKELTKVNSRIHLYELYQPGSKTYYGANQFIYFISLQSHSRLDAWNIGSKNFVPNFHEKMSRLVADCPVLSGKIAQKMKGYHLGQIVLSNGKKS